MSELPAPRSPCGGPSLHLLRRLDTGELNDLAAYKVRLHVGSCEACQRVLREFAEDRASLHTTLPLARLGASLAQTLSPRRLLLRAGLGLLVPLAAAAAFFLAPSSPDQPLPVPGIRAKGGSTSGPALDFFVQSSGGPRAGTDGEPLKAGDQIRLRYDSGASSFVLIVGVDADGNVFPYLADRDRSARASAGGALAPNAIELDADPRPERVFAIYSNEPIAIDEVKPVAKDAVRSVGGHLENLVELPMKSAAQRSLLINKVPK